MEVERVHAEVECGLKISRSSAQLALHLARDTDSTRRTRFSRPRLFALQHTLAPIQHSLTMCTDTTDDYLNALRAPDGVDAKATITLKYGPYMN